MAAHAQTFKNLLTELPKDKKTVVFGCYVYSEGIGDLMHLVTKANPEYLQSIHAFEGYEKIYLIAYDDPEHLDLIDSILASYNIKNFYLTKISNYLNLEGEYNQFLLTKPGLKKKLLKSSAFFNFSTAGFEEIFKTCLGIHRTGSIPFISMGEHGADTFVKTSFSSYKGDVSNNETANQYYRHMGFSINHYGIFINPPKDSLTKPECLSSIKDNVFLNLLLKSSTGSHHLKTCQEFLNSSFLLPGYFQEGMATFMAFVQAISTSPLIKGSEFNDIVFIMNDGNFDEKYLDLPYLRLNNIESIEYMNVSKGIERTIRVQPLGKASAAPRTKGIKIRILEGYRLEDEDYKYLIRSATTFYGCSGDNTFESAFSYALIPLYQIRHFKEVLFDSFIFLAARVMGEQSKTVDYLCALKSITNIKRPKRVSNSDVAGIPAADLAICELAMAIRPELLEEWRKFADYIQKHYNFARVLPLIYQQVMHRVELNQMPKQADIDIEALREKLSAEIQRLENQINSTHSFEMKEILERIPHGFPKPGKPIVDLCKFHLNAEKLTAILSLLRKHSQITELDLSNNIIALKIVWPDFVKFLVESPHVTTLKLTNCALNDQMIQDMISKTASIPFKELELRYNRFTKAGVRWIAALLKGPKTFSSLEKVDLMGNNLDDKSVDLLLKGIEQSIEKGRKTKLDLIITSNPKISEDAKTRLMALQKRHPDLLKVTLDERSRSLPGLGLNATGAGAGPGAAGLGADEGETETNDPLMFQMKMLMQQLMRGGDASNDAPTATLNLSRFLTQLKGKDAAHNPFKV